MILSPTRGGERRADMGARQTQGRRVAGEIGGAFADLGSFLPHTLGAITAAGLAPVGVLLSYGIAQESGCAPQDQH